MARKKETSSTEIRRPTQQRSRDRFDAILDAAERLLETQDPAEVGIHQIAATLGIAAASIYHFFPEPGLVFRALAERYIQQIEVLDEGEPRVVSPNWQESQTRSFRRSREYFNGHVAARKVILGSALSYDIRSRDFESDRVLAERGVERMNQEFTLPDTPGMVDRFLEVIVISDALWSLSIHRSGLITEEMEEQARRARIGYTRTFLPEYLPRRDAASR
ncbi:TetR/AcrR family transcriptional regulator [Sphingomonas sp.]|uniref:TetR/AcrR family transcriptional regulator n=1 Tax=Sphingomonas sp. TaxID=28214 RepID=UPI003AFFB60E